MTNPSAFSVREIANQNTIIPFRTTQIGTSNQILGSGGSLGFHASNFVNRAAVHQIIFVGDGFNPTNYDVEFFMNSSLASNTRQYYNQSINLREIDNSLIPILIIDNNNSNCLHGKITNQGGVSGMMMNYIELRYNRLLEVS